MIDKILKFIKNNKQNILIFLVIVAVVILSSLPLFAWLDISTDDGANFKGLLEGMKANIMLVHQVPYRINTVTLYGGQIPIFYHLTFFYLYFVFHLLLSLSEIVSFNWTLIIINILTSISMFFTVKTISKNKNVALVSTIMYMTAIYRLCDIYKRGALGETISFIFIPLLILSVYKIFYENIEKKSDGTYVANKINNIAGLLFLLSTTFILQDHMLTTYLYFVLILLLLFIFAFKNKHIIDYKKRYLYFIKYSIFTFLLNAWYLFPIFYEYLFVDFINPAFYLGITYFSYPSNISDFFTINPSNQTVTTLGFQYSIAIILCIISLVLFFKKKEKLKKREQFLFVLFLISIIVYLLTFDFVSFDAIRQTKFRIFIEVLQFRFRLFLLVLPLIAISVPILIQNLLLSNKLKKIFYGLIVFSSLLTSSLYINNIFQNSYFNSMITLKAWNLDYYLTGTESKAGYLYDYNLVIHNQNIKTSNLNIKPNYVYTDYEVVFDENDTKDSYSIDFPLFNYPVYKVYDENHNIIEHSTGVNNLIRVPLTKNKGSIEIIYKEPLFWVIGNIISLIIILSLLLFGIYNLYKKRK